MDLAAFPKCKFRVFLCLATQSLYFQIKAFMVKINQPSFKQTTKGPSFSSAFFQLILQFEVIDQQSFLWSFGC